MIIKVKTLVFCENYKNYEYGDVHVIYKYMHYCFPKDSDNKTQFGKDTYLGRKDMC